MIADVQSAEKVLESGVPLVAHMDDARLVWGPKWTNENGNDLPASEQLDLPPGCILVESHRVIDLEARLEAAQKRIRQLEQEQQEHRSAGKITAAVGREPEAPCGATLQRPAPPDYLQRGPHSLPDDVIVRCVARLEIALVHGSRDEAIASIDEAFVPAAKELVTLDSPLVDLGLPIRVVNALESRGMTCVADLCEWSYTQLFDLPHFGRLTADQIRLAVERYGLSLNSMVIDRPGDRGARIA